jgi:hypothetical protein
MSVKMRDGQMTTKIKRKRRGEKEGKPEALNKQLKGIKFSYFYSAPSQSSPLKSEHHLFTQQRSVVYMCYSKDNIPGSIHCAPM